jgi:quercetin dioxygenase-like cupin family protein
MQHMAWDSVKKEIMNDKLWRRVLHGEKITMAQLGLSKDCAVPLHHHENEQISVILQGLLKFNLGGQELLARGGDVVVIPPNVPHSVLALEDSIAMDVFSPIRQDWLAGTDNYLRK